MIEEAVSKQRAQITTPAELAAAREARGMSQVDISQRIKLQIRQLDALEDGRWDALPGKSFVRGALRSYGKLLDVDVAPLLESIGGFAEPSQFAGSRSLQASISKSSGRGFSGDGRSTIPWVIAGLIGAVALVLYFGSEGDSERIRSWFPSAAAPWGEPVNPATAPPGAVPPAASPATAAAGIGSAVAPAPPQVTQPPPPAQAAPAVPAGVPASGTLPSVALAPETTAAGRGSAAPAQSAAKAADSNVGAGTSGAAGTPGAETAVPSMSRPAPTVPAPQAPPASPGEPAATLAGPPPVAPASASAKEPDELASAKGRIRFKAGLRDSWIEVRQSDGTTLHNGLVQAGGSIELNGTPPYRLTVGNASHLQVTYDGKVLDLKPHMRPNDIARLQVN